jgi:hypothetical protein
MKHYELPGVFPFPRRLQRIGRVKESGFSSNFDPIGKTGYGSKPGRFYMIPTLSDLAVLFLIKPRPHS